MSYRLETAEPFTPGLKRIATEQIDKALDQLQDPDPDRDEAVHDARKRFKKLRAVMRLVRDELGSSVYDRENKCYRDAGRRLSDVRDSYVMIETLDNLRARYEDELADDAFATVRDNLVARHETIRRRILDEADAIEQVIDTITEARTRIETLPLAEIEYDDIAPSIRRVYKRGYKGFARAYDDPQAEHFHEWRKRVKYLWYHTRILRRLWPDLMAELADQIHDLSDYLGDAHDLAEFKALLHAEPELTADDTAREVLLALCSQWQQALREQARPLGQRVYAEEPNRFVERNGRYWQAAPYES